MTENIIAVVSWAEYSYVNRGTESGIRLLKIVSHYCVTDIFHNIKITEQKAP